MRRAWLRAVVLASGIVWAAPAGAADQWDGPAASADPAADIGDLYAWMSADGTKVNLVLTVWPWAELGDGLSPDVQYAFHVGSGDGLAADGGLAAETLVLCEMPEPDRITCWVGEDDFVSGDPGAPEGVASASGAVLVFAGLRNDPFFFRLGGFDDARALVRDAWDGLSFDEAGCPAYEPALGGALFSAVTGGSDEFAGSNVVALAIEVDVELVAVGGPVLGVWASTHRRDRGAP